MAKRQHDNIFWLMRSRPGRLEIKRRYGTKVVLAASNFAGLYRRTLGRRVHIVAVIGSVGKTTTMRAVSAVMGVPVSRPQLLNTNSPTAIGRQLLGLRPWRKSAVLEVAISSPGHMKMHAKSVRPNVVVVTAIARDHWQSFATLENTRAEKAEMLRSLRPNDVAILNADDENVRWMATQTKARVVWMGERQDAEVRASDIELDWPHGMRFVAHIDDASYPVATQLMGKHMVLPALAALAVAYVEGLPIGDAIEALAILTPTIGRMQILPIANGAVAIRDDFKASVDPYVAALTAFEEVPSNRRLVVFGEVSEESSHSVYREIGQQAGRFADRAIFVGSSTNLQTFRAGTKSAGMPSDAVSHVRDWYEASALIRDDLQPGDAVLIKGRWQQALGRVGLALAGRDVRCRADPCPFKRMLCDVCPFLEQEFYGLPDS